MLHKDTHSQAKSYHSELINILSCYVEGFNFRFKHEKTIKVFYYIISEYLGSYRRFVLHSFT